MEEDISVDRQWGDQGEEDISVDKEWGDQGETQGDSVPLVSPGVSPGDTSLTEEHGMYFGEDTDTKMTHLMHSDTMIVVVALVVMIVVGMAFRSLFLKLTSVKTRKARMRGGLKALADHMNVVTRAMSNDLEPQNSPKAVMKTYSNYSRGLRGGVSKEETGTKGGESTTQSGRHLSREDLRVQAFSNVLALEGVCHGSGAQGGDIEMVESQRHR